MNDDPAHSARANKARADLQSAVSDAATHQEDTGDRDIARAFVIVQGMFDHTYDLIRQVQRAVEGLDSRLSALEQQTQSRS